MHPKKVLMAVETEVVPVAGAVVGVEEAAKRQEKEAAAREHRGGENVSHQRRAYPCTLLLSQSNRVLKHAYRAVSTDEIARHLEQAETSVNRSQQVPINQG
jgi:hypothetical protein